MSLGSASPQHSTAALLVAIVVSCRVGVVLVRPGPAFPSHPVLLVCPCLPCLLWRVKGPRAPLTHSPAPSRPCCPRPSIRLFFFFFFLKNHVSFVAVTCRRSTAQDCSAQAGRPPLLVLVVTWTPRAKARARARASARASASAKARAKTRAKAKAAK
ncbi:uncharacterized protein J3D65DRAFT_642016 [Phyllosticta citribraziliensis]|uniref:Secreted protein n=1 Tax=Phyllosticta citribraziliensis TaxID=989973 RepID=A0ABR1L726_9PEZI